MFTPCVVTNSEGEYDEENIDSLWEEFLKSEYKHYNSYYYKYEVGAFSSSSKEVVETSRNQVIQRAKMYDAKIVKVKKFEYLCV